MDPRSSIGINQLLSLSGCNNPFFFDSLCVVFSRGPIRSLNCSTKLFKTLQDKVIPFEMMTYPGGKHGISGKETRKHLFNTILNFLDRNLKNPVMTP